MKIPNFNDKNLLEQVFMHRSYLNESAVKVESNERLEFLGDSILSFVVSSYIFNHNKSFHEGELTNLRSVLTNTQTLYVVSKELGLGQYLKLSKGEETGKGRENKTILANTLEALIGGIYIDQGIEAARQFIEESIIARSEEIITSQGLKDAKSSLQEILQEKHKQSPLYKILSEAGPDHDKKYTIGVFLKDKLLAKGVGHSKQEAEKDAAANALLIYSASF
ncbi:MAG: ribonuclease III [Candidatus Levybacteria bacterium CG_4_10_14_0_2_um_filter_36_16]|nr:MAG: ribonuclease III [Candidatus Levybacteria bacterium CG2_30_37_29]PIR79647.1 MAG: ribonuclease III [Candidatus Levybacteria bacterium CG10_big_fil_rev_8_21_14_0_10_36_30]PIZ97751.1 MAG: ribonuclease III [Candidatus Levybacteria bacterium CG_4_10_14_0_2_um_filter_36_16]PJA90619.1 MAG: ribonuclease III [Candidatus Levybacteria bacterium CG_4_9_14_3_um_filter_36_7]